MGDSRRFFWKMVNVPAVTRVRILKGIMQLPTPRFWYRSLLTNHLTSRGKSDIPSSCMPLPGWHQAGGSCSATNRWSVCEGRVLHHPAQAQKSISACRPHKSSLMMDPMQLEVLTCLNNVCLLWKKNRVVNWVLAEGQKCLLCSGQAHEEWHKPHRSSSISDIVRKGIVRNLAPARAVCGDSCWTSGCNLTSGSSKALNLIPCVFTLSISWPPTLFWSLLSHSTYPQLVHDCVCRSLPTLVPCVFQWLPESWLSPFLGDFLAYKASLSPFCYCNQPWNKLTEMKALFFFLALEVSVYDQLDLLTVNSWPGCKKRKEEGLRSLLYNQNTSH